MLLFGIIFNGDYHMTTMWHSFCLKNVLVGLRLLDFANSKSCEHEEEQMSFE